MINLLKETLEILEQNDKLPKDVQWVGTKDSCFTWEEFEAISDFEYHDGYGGAEINTELKVVGENWWLERGEYDGSEWWEFKTLPNKPICKIIPNKELINKGW